MKRKSNTVICVGASVGILILIIDSQSALAAVRDGIAVCVQTIIPALFPLFFLSGLLINRLHCTAALRPLGRLCRMPRGGEVFLVLGLLGGYPVGSGNIAQAVQDGILSQNDAKRMLAFCNNAGPAFLFGILPAIYHEWYIPWLLWLIHILSAILTGMLMPGSSVSSIAVPSQKNKTVSDLMGQSIKSIAYVCGWIILFRILLQFMQRWFLWILPPEVQVLISGMIELTNGCLGLKQIANPSVKFVMGSGLIAFGGLCVTMQTAAFIRDIGAKSYITGKLFQTIISLFLSGICAVILYSGGLRAYFLPGMAVILTGWIVFYKIAVEKHLSFMYN